MEPAMDCQQGQEKQTPHTVNKPKLFTTGGLAVALSHRGYVCTRDTVDHFISTRGIKEVRRHGNYRMFDRTALDLLRVWLQKRGKKRA